MSPILLVMLILNIHTGQPIKEVLVDQYTTIESCEEARAKLGPQRPKGDMIAMYSCIIENKTT